ncbi:MAG: membrane protein insertase YidC [Acidobacteriota bacterium]|nr:membrane protein insertase YidC [Acidobacteriota bacterium]
MPEFSNPNQSGAGGQDSKSLIAMMVVMVAVFFGLQAYRAKTNPPTVPPNAAPAQSKAVTPAPSAQGPVTAAPGSSPQPSGPSSPAASAAPEVLASAEQTTAVENELYRITFTNRGAQVTSWILKTQTDSTGHPLDVVHHQAAQRFGAPLSLYTYDATTAAALNQALWVSGAGAGGTPGAQLSAPATLTFKYSANGLEATKTFSFDESYVLHADVAVTRGGVPVRALLAWPGGFGDQDNAAAYNGAQLDLDRNGSDDHLAPKKVSGGDTLNGPIDWAGVSDPFFAAVFLPDAPATASIATLHNELDVKKASSGRGSAGAYLGLGAAEPGKGDLKVPLLGLALGDTSGHTAGRIFVGPKAISVLKSIHAADSKVTLEPLLEFGFWGIIGKYLFLALQFIHTHLASNWGWAIVILTVLINILTLPFKVKTMQSALKMQRIQPQMDAIKERYKKYKVTDPKRNDMNAEIMQLQKDNGVNMFGGCIPTLITLPMLWAFFTMLPRVVELRHAHWLWLPDLQAPDPYHILPILMVGSMFLMQYYTPSPGVDPQQQKMMAFMMPAVSGYFTWNYGSGLALYWAVGNLIGIAQQMVMNRTSLGREMKEIAAKRARRKNGSAPVIQARR